MPTPDAIDALLRLGAPGLLVFAIVALVSEVVVSGRAYKRVQSERDMAYSRLDRFIDVVEAATGIKAPK